MLKRLALVCNIVGWLCFLPGLAVGIIAGYIMQREGPYGIGFGAMVGAGAGVSAALFWWVVAWIVRPRDGEDAISGRPMVREQRLGQFDGRERVEPTAAAVLMSPEEIAERRGHR
jgi:hypothetical protein